MLRVKIELVPHGVESAALTLDEILIENDGTGFSTGEHEGGVGNYNVFDGETIDHLHMVDYPSMYACGYINNVKRTPEHRMLLAESAISVVQQARSDRWRDRLGKGYSRPERDPEKENTKTPKTPPDNLNVP